MGKFWDYMFSPMGGAGEIDAYWKRVNERKANKNPSTIIHKHVHIYGANDVDELSYDLEGEEIYD